MNVYRRAAVLFLILISRAVVDPTPAHGRILPPYEPQMGETKLRLGGVDVALPISVLGTIGEHDRIDTTVLSDAVNVSSRLQALSSDYGASILASDAATDLEGSRDLYYARFADIVRLKGREQATTIHEILPAGVRETKSRFDTIYRSAFDALRLMDIDTAERRIIECTESYPDDAIYEMFRRRVAQFQADGFPPNWDGSVGRTVK